MNRSRQDTRSQPPVSHARDSRTASSRVTEAIDEIRDGVDRRTVSAPPVTRDSPAVRAAPSVSATSGQDLLQQLTLSTGLSREDMIRKFAEQTQSTRGCLFCSFTVFINRHYQVGCFTSACECVIVYYVRCLTDDRRTPSSLPDRVPLAQPTAKPGKLSTCNIILPTQRLIFKPGDGVEYKVACVDVSRRKEEMIRSITAYSDTLKSRLQIETEKLRLVTQGEFLLSGAFLSDCLH